MWCTPTTSLQLTSWLVPHNFLLTDMSRLLKTSYKSSDRFFKQTKYHLRCITIMNKTCCRGTEIPPLGPLNWTCPEKSTSHDCFPKRRKDTPLGASLYSWGLWIIFAFWKVWWDNVMCVHPFSRVCVASSHINVARTFNTL